MIIYEAANLENSSDEFQRITVIFEINKIEGSPDKTMGDMSQ